jgi:hypothetical protein
MLDWLLAQPGDTWQDRWLASGADADGRCWRHIPVRWLNLNSSRNSVLRCVVNVKGALPQR